MFVARHNIVTSIAAIALAAIAVALFAGGIMLIAAGGSWYYAIAGAGFGLTAWLLYNRRPAALLAYALIVVGTLVWALWEVGFDWWPLAARGGLIFVIGAVLLTPPITRRLGLQTLPQALDGIPGHSYAFRGIGLALSASLALATAVAVVSWFTDLHRISGEAVSAEAPAPNELNVPDGEWHSYGRTAYGQRYSPMAQITPQNVSDLEVAWHYRTGDVSEPTDPEETTFQVTPLKIGDRLFLCTPHQSVIALNATTGEQIWRYDPQIQGELTLQHLTCRGLSYQPPAETTADNAPVQPATEPAQAAVAVRSDPGQPIAAEGHESGPCNAKLFMPTADGRLIAINPDNGAVCSDFGGGDGQIDLWNNMPNVNPGSYYSTSPVVVTQDLIIVGGTVLDNVSTAEASGVIRAFDIQTGDLVWNWDSGNPDETTPLPAGQTYMANSPNSWSISSVDEALGLVYIPMGNQPPDQWGGNRTQEAGTYSSSVVALDLATGQVRWVFQTVHHDLWDYDVPSQPTLVDLQIRGEMVPALVQPTKQGEIFVLDRRTGEPLLPVTEVAVPQGAAEGDQTAPTQPVSALSFDPPALREKDMWGATMLDQMACRIAFHKYRYEGRFTPPSEEGSLIYPGNFGVFNWGGVAVDPVRQLVFTTPSYLAFTSQLVRRADNTNLVVNDEAPDGALPALNENFGAPFAVEMGPFVSALGLPCEAPPWGYVAAADLRTGNIIWQHKNGTVRDASPIPLPFAMGVPNLGGPIMTASGLAFLSGTIDYYIRAYDVSTGEELWKDRLPAGGQSTPMTYEGADGRQYLLVVAGGHGSLGTRRGDSVIAYALPQ
ncbi:glucose/quinate/shikimate family membrane-bound PQQ-dependent dehydrogenase [Aureimonas fodinaquatilis]|uniref:Glucose/quinate/shikimate family membrane-bound PQQ-dependent dehydrogenase n=1 Tax=Aureimonas fodinaquatilis TaxID=2565783 RepID=A0A5B0DSH2_9HYPH|nr:glucose/quinate/shikimate family membrane-bound PQQ-dependent dehydrogenase [Aureimonas fodinaquatilis]KAA0969333.1 glucose/quinate/shikimate family membrane-bound PQQ-dependent dehydrogenase [Aureimonas fodinaquatilis]